MFDTLISGATLVDGMGAAPYTADLGIQDGRIAAIGNLGTNASAHTHIDGRGAWLTPGFVDIHTHYDGQASWDETFSPSIHHGVTTLVMGNCGVGFAPLVPGRERALIDLMEGVEDIPGVALAEGVRFNWASFPEYMRALDAQPHSLDFLVQVPHDPLRMAVMGSRASAREAATESDMAAMAALLRQALEAGAAGFSTGRTDNHRTARGEATPASKADLRELTGLAAAFQGLSHGVLQVVSDFDVMQTLGATPVEQSRRFNEAFDLIEAMARASGRPLSMTWLQRDPGGDQWKAMQSRVESAVAAGLPLSLQTAARGIGVIVGLDASFHPFMGFASYQEVAMLPLAARAQALRDPKRRARILAEKSQPLSGDGTPVPPIVDMLLSRIEMISARMFALESSSPDYEPGIADSFYMRAKRAGITALEALYNHLAEGDGGNLVYFPIFNYNDGSLDVVRQMLDHPRALLALSDAGAHVGTVCDASFTTFMLTHWVLGRATHRLPLERAVQMLTSRNADHMGLADRGRLQVGLRADLNLIDPQQLRIEAPIVVRDLPAGGRRFLQKASGYRGTWVAGQAVQVDGQVTTARPGRLVRMGNKP